MAAATKEAPTTPAASTAPSVPPMTRREFLYYIWAASMALFLAETGGAILWFAVPRFKAGEFGGVFELDIANVPPTSHALPVADVLRADELRPCLTRDAVLSGAPLVEDGRFRVPRILGEAP